MHAVLLRSPGRSEISAQTRWTAAAFSALATRKSSDHKGAASEVMVDNDLLHELDDTALEHRVLHPHERLGERESVRRCEEDGHIGQRRRRFGRPALDWHAR